MSGHGAPAVRVGMHHGTAIERDSDYIGGAVNLAARVSAAATGGEVLLTAQTAALTPVVEAVLYESRGRQTLRNVREPVELVAAVRQGPNCRRPACGRPRLQDGGRSGPLCRPSRVRRHDLLLLHPCLRRSVRPPSRALCQLTSLVVREHRRRVPTPQNELGSPRAARVLGNAGLRLSTAPTLEQVYDLRSMASSNSPNSRTRRAELAGNDVSFLEAGLATTIQRTSWPASRSTARQPSGSRFRTTAQSRGRTVWRSSSTAVPPYCSTRSTAIEELVICLK
jgi:hypothetical protein